MYAALRVHHTLAWVGMHAGGAHEVVRAGRLLQVGRAVALQHPLDPAQAGALQPTGKQGLCTQRLIDVLSVPLPVHLQLGAAQRVQPAAQRDAVVCPGRLFDAVPQLEPHEALGGAFELRPAAMSQTIGAGLPARGSQRGHAGHIVQPTRHLPGIGQ